MNKTTERIIGFVSTTYDANMLENPYTIKGNFYCVVKSEFSKRFIEATSAVEKNGKWIITTSKGDKVII